jgi:hypothetical protein
MKKLTKKEIEEIRKNPKSQDWLIISHRYKLTEEFIREFRDRVWWVYISYTQELSENFIREFHRKVQWDSISRYQNLSEEFMIEFINDIHIRRLFDNRKIPQDVKDKIIALKSLL